MNDCILYIDTLLSKANCHSLRKQNSLFCMSLNYQSSRSFTKIKSYNSPKGLIQGKVSTYQIFEFVENTNDSSSFFFFPIK